MQAMGNTHTRTHKHMHIHTYHRDFVCTVIATFLKPVIGLHLGLLAKVVAALGSELGSDVGHAYLGNPSIGCCRRTRTHRCWRAVGAQIPHARCSMLNFAQSKVGHMSHLFAGL